MIKFKHKGDFAFTDSFFDRIRKRTYLRNIDAIARKGVEALAAATPKDTGKTANSWYYTIEDKNGELSIVWNNSNEVSSANSKYTVNVALILQYGHGTKNGGWVEGLDYINPAMQPVFDELLSDAWEEVCRR